MSFHINPSTGDVGVCRAKKSCPFGDLESDHYSSRKEAVEAFELSQSTFSFPVKELAGSEYDYLFPTMTARVGNEPTLEAELESNPNRAVHCLKCGERIGNAVVALYLQEPGTFVKCQSCLTVVAAASVASQVGIVVAPNPDSQTFLAVDKANVSKILWYHTSSVANWDKAIQSSDGPDRVHLGSERAAADRAAQLLDRPYLYVLEVSSESSIDDELHQESENDFQVEAGKADDVVRYLNMYEDSGSVSLAVNPKAIKVLGYRKLTAREIEPMGTYSLDQDPENWLQEHSPEYLNY